MEWLKRLFRRRNDRDEEPDTLDLRSEEEIQIEKETKRALFGPDEDIAKMLCDLLNKSKEYKDEPWKEVVRIGEQLNSNGGHTRMLKVCYRVQALEGKARTLELAWNGIGKWLG